MKKYIKPAIIIMGKGSEHVVSKGCGRSFNADCGILARM